jgi:trimeric autotransporter adhesin
MDGVFLVKMVARPDARLVEVPLEIEAELPRDFDGAALLAASGLPRKVRLKAPKDALKLSTAYRTDQLLADVVRSALRGSPEDAARVQEVVLGFVRGVRERRLDGATLLLRWDGTGQIELSELAPEAAGKAVLEAAKAAPQAAKTAAARGGTAAQADAAGRADARARGTAADRLAGLERRVAQLESWRRRRSTEDSPLSAVSTLSPLSPVSGSEGAGGAQRGRGALRRGTAVDAFSDGLRKELSGRAAQLLGAADRGAFLCDEATRLAAEAVRDLGAPPLGSEGDALHRLATQAAARQRALQRFLDEVDLYAPAELLMAERLLARLAPAAQEGTLDLDPAGPLSALGEQLLRHGRGSELLAVWVARAAPLCRWTLIEPRVGDPLRLALHEAKDGGAEGALIARPLLPGVLRPDGSVLVRARVSLENDSAEAAEWAKALRDPPPAASASASDSASASSPASASDSAPASSPASASDSASPSSTSPASASASASASATPSAAIAVSDDDVEVLEDLGPLAGAAPGAPESSQKPSDKPWED